MKLAYVLFTGLILVCSACEDLPENSPTYGTTQVVADETLYPVVDALVTMFERTYPKANVEITYLPEARAFQQFYDNDSTKLVISARELTEDESGFFRNKKINPRTALFANDAIALLVNPSNPDTNLVCEQALGVFNGIINNWKSISAGNKSGPVLLVFDHQASSTVRFAMEKSGVKTLPPNSFAQKTTEAVVDYVSTHPGALGIIGYSWLSDYDDPVCQRLRSKVRVAAISKCQDSQAGPFFRPFADNVKEDNYPFSRKLFLINRETSSGLGTGLSAFIAGEMGQRIISKTGILPAYRVEHNIELKSEPFRVKK